MPSCQRICPYFDLGLGHKVCSPNCTQKFQSSWVFALAPLVPRRRPVSIEEWPQGAVARLLQILLTKTPNSSLHIVRGRLVVRSSSVSQEHPVQW